MLASPYGCVLGLLVHGDGSSVYAVCDGPFRGTAGAVYWDGGGVTRGFQKTVCRGFLTVFTGLLTRIRWLLLDNLGSSPLDGELLAVMAVLVTSASQVPVMTFFPCLLSGFLAYLYAWYCFLALFSLESKMQMIPLEAFYSGLGYM